MQSLYMMMQEQVANDVLDVLIIGGGPIGMACGIECVKNDLSYLIVEKGCLVNSLYNYPLNMTFFSTSDRLEIGGVPFISHNYKPTRSEALEYYRRVALSWKLRIKLYEAVTYTEKRGDIFVVHTSRNRKYFTRAIIVATGFYDIPNKLNVPGEDLPKVHHYFREAHPYFGQRIAVIGAANSAVDVALETYRKGAAEVTMIIREEQISDRVKYWVKPDIENRIKNEEIKAYFQSQVVAIREEEIDVQTPQGLITLPNDFVLAMTGYLPNFALLENLGVQIQDDEMRTPVYNEATMETNQPNVYLAGVVCGGLQTNKWFIENSRVHAVTIIQDLKRKKMALQSQLV